MIRRVASLLITLFLISILTQALVRILPGDPLSTIIAETGTKIPVEELRRQLHLDQGFLESIVFNTQNMLRGDWGVSLITRRPVLPILMEHFTQTLILSSAVLVIGIFWSFFFGVAAILSPALFRFITFWGIASASLPAVVLGPLILSLTRSIDSIASPILVISIPFVGFWSRLVHARIQETLALPFVQSARSRGLPELQIVLKYGLFPSLGALIAQLGTYAGVLFTGSLVTEYIFSRVGMGTLLVDSVLKRDYPLITAAVLCSSAFCLLGTLFGDLGQNLVDPRQRNTEQTAK